MYKHRRLFFSVLIMVTLIGVASWWTFAGIRSNIREEIGGSLNIVLETTHQAVSSWAREHRSEVQLWADLPEVVRITEEILAVEPVQEILVNSPIQAELRELFLPLTSPEDHHGFFIISPQNINLGSTRDNNIGIVNLLTEQGDVLERLWSGETVLTLPQQSDVPLLDENGNLIADAATMFVGTPIRDEKGEVIAILTVRIKPFQNFSGIFQQGRLGESGETYAFDTNGLLISESRFVDQLREIGLIGGEELGILNVDIRDPGVNLVEGEHIEIPKETQPLTRMAASALVGESGIDLEGYRDYRGVPVIGAWLWDEELGFGMTTEIDVSEA